MRRITFEEDWWDGVACRVYREQGGLYEYWLLPMSGKCFEWTTMVPNIRAGAREAAAQLGIAKPRYALLRRPMIDGTMQENFLFGLCHTVAEARDLIDGDCLHDQIVAIGRLRV